MSQQEVYEALLQAEGYLSGEELSRRLQITRAAVWKAVESLRKQGCEIEASTGLGYRLCGESLLQADAIARCLSVPRTRIHVSDSVDSTNLECRRLAAQGAPCGTVVAANQQTLGRGRRGRSFESPKGLGLYLSILWRPQCAPQALLPLTALSAVATRRAIHRVCEASCDIKWPNDLTLHGKKIAGILTEMSLEGETGTVDYVVLGIGINVRHRAEDFTPEVAAIASSLERELGHRVRRSALAAALIEELDLLYDDILPRPRKWLEEYRSACLNLGKTVQLIQPDGSRQKALALDIDEQFGLTVQYPDGKTQTLRSGEVSVRGLYGYAE